MDIFKGIIFNLNSDFEEELEDEEITEVIEAIIKKESELIKENEVALLRIKEEEIVSSFILDFFKIAKLLAEYSSFEAYFYQGFLYIDFFNKKHNEDEPVLTTEISFMYLPLKTKIISNGHTFSYPLNLPVFRAKFFNEEEEFYGEEILNLLENFEISFQHYNILYEEGLSSFSKIRNYIY